MSTSMGPYRNDAGNENIEIISGTFLGNETRSMYGKGPVPEELNIKWRYYIGGGETVVYKDTTVWYGIGWTGQPTMYRENDSLYLIIGGFDHKVHKINAETGRDVWTYEFDDIIKGTATLLRDFDSIIILQGSRRGVNKAFTDPLVHSFRAISGKSGEELWRFNIPLTDSYSRDIDGSALILNDRIILGAENGYVYIINPFKTYNKNGFTYPVIEKSIKLYDYNDIEAHKWNLVIESSPSYFGDRVFITSGAGHIYALDVHTWDIVMDIKTGSDMDGSPVICRDGSILCTIEKEYIKGLGGVLKINPDNSVAWYFPTADRELTSWKGGVIGSVAISDYIENEYNQLAAFNAIDGYMYVVRLNQILSDSMVLGYDSLSLFHTPEMVFKYYIGGSISTPLLIDDYLITAGYDSALRIFKIDYDSMQITQSAYIYLPGSIEGTPVVYDGFIYVGCRDGYLYCLGEDSGW